ncbi:extensin-like domain-containing protein [Oceanibium sediminis]|uniref:extensin-like domain-containing protein n=1 Tax=Oceanibium sediminis TaxID=2026339 RepID=UPI00130017FE|nr:extensin family protein [Oceanibium sediminis]
MLLSRAARALALLAALGSCGIGGSSGERLARSLDLPSEVGGICGNGRIIGIEMEDLGNPGGGCGIKKPVRVYAVGGVRLSPTARINCDAAQAMLEWVDGHAQPVANKTGTQLVSINVAASYACRRRNNRPSGKLSEHAKGHALDLYSFTFANGDTASVLKDYNSGRYKKLMQRFHKQACGPFGVVLGPRADRHHRDHFHFDISNRRRPYCR